MMRHCSRICTMLIASVLLLSTGTASAQVCLYADFDNDGDSDVYFINRILLIMVNSLSVAIIFTDFASSGFEIHAGLVVDYRYSGHGLGKGDVYRFSACHPIFKAVRNIFRFLRATPSVVYSAGGADLPAESAGRFAVANSRNQYR